MLRWLRNRLRDWLLRRIAIKTVRRRLARAYATAGLDFEVGDRVETASGVSLVAPGEVGTVLEVLIPCHAVLIEFDRVPGIALVFGCCELQYALDKKGRRQ